MWHIVTKQNPAGVWVRDEISVQRLPVDFFKNSSKFTLNVGECACRLSLFHRALSLSLSLCLMCFNGFSSHLNIIFRWDTEICLVKRMPISPSCYSIYTYQPANVDLHHQQHYHHRRRCCCCWIHASPLGAHFTTILFCIHV